MQTFILGVLFAAFMVMVGIETIAEGTQPIAFISAVAGFAVFFVLLRVFWLFAKDSFNLGQRQRQCQNQPQICAPLDRTHAGQ